MDSGRVSSKSLRPPRRLRLLFTLAAVLPGACARVQAGPDVPGSHPILERLESIEAEYLAEEPGDTRSPNLRSAIDVILEKIKPSGAPAAGARSVQLLNRLIFDELAIQPSSDLHDPGNLLVSRVLERRQGYCVGLAALYLALAERLDLSIFAVDTPNHVFLRYDDGVTRNNIETMDRGADRDDADYIRERNIPEASIRRGVFMRALSTDEFIARFRSNLGVVLSERKRYERAARQYRTAMELDPLLAAAYYNLANDLLWQGDWQASVRLFSKSLKLYPTDVWALNNRGLAHFKLGKVDRARRDFETALGIDPGFEQARTNLKSIR